MGNPDFHEDASVQYEPDSADGGQDPFRPDMEDVRRRMDLVEKRVKIVSFIADLERAMKLRGGEGVEDIAGRVRNVLQKYAETSRPEAAEQKPESEIRHDADPDGKMHSLTFKDADSPDREIIAVRVMQQGVHEFTAGERAEEITVVTGHIWVSIKASEGERWEGAVALGLNMNMYRIPRGRRFTISVDKSPAMCIFGMPLKSD